VPGARCIGPHLIIWGPHPPFPPNFYRHVESIAFSMILISHSETKAFFQDGKKPQSLFRTEAYRLAPSSGSDSLRRNAKDKKIKVLCRKTKMLIFGRPASDCNTYQGCSRDGLSHRHKARPQYTSCASLTPLQASESTVRVLLGRVQDGNSL
jgi:hypothetical protein